MTARYVNSGSLPDVTGGYAVPRAGSSGDDTNAINNALADNPVVIFGGDYYTSDSIVIPSNRVLIMIGQPGFHLKSGAQATVMRNADWTNGNSGITLAGDFWIDGNAEDQTHTAGAQYGCGLVLGAVTNFRQIGCAYVGPCNKSAVYVAGSAYPATLLSNGVSFEHIELNQDGTTANQDGLDIAYGAKFVKVARLTGVSGDDFLAILAYDSHAVTGFSNQGVSHVSIGELVGLSLGANMLRAESGDTKNISEVALGRLSILYDGVHVPDSTIQIGGSDAIVPAAAGSQLRDITIGEIQMAMGAGIVNLDQYCQDITIGRIVVSDEATSISYIIGSTAAGVHHADRVHVGSVYVPSGAATTTLVKFAGNSTVTELAIRDVQAAQLQYLLNNSRPVDVDIRRVHIGTLTGALVHSTTEETGVLSDVHVETLTGPSYLASASKLRYGGEFPTLTSADTAPTATKGSELYGDHTANLSGAGDGHGEKVVGNGSTFVRVADLGTSF